jgi:hypothetical protein
MVHAEKKYGKLGLQRVMAPAIKLAAEGFVLSAEEAKELTDPDLAKFPDSKRIFQRDGNLYKEGEIFKQPELARTLQRIATDPDSFYHGALAHELVNELHKGGALLTLEDLAQYTVEERTPITGKFHNYTVISAPPPSSGGIALLTALNILRLTGALIWIVRITWAIRTTIPSPWPSLRQRNTMTPGVRRSIRTRRRQALHSPGPPAFCRPRPRLPASDGMNPTKPRTTRLWTAKGTQFQ